MKVGKADPMVKKKPSSPSRKTRGRKPSKRSLKEFRPVEGEIVEPASGSSTPAEPPETDLPEVDLAWEHAADEAPATADRALASTDPVSRYLSEIGRYPLLTREQERELAVRYRETGDPKAAEKLVTSNLRFVVKVAAEYTRFGARLIDLVQEGNVGLMHAVKEFNPYKGVRLITYAVWWIRGYIQEYLMRQYSLVRIGTTATQRKLFYQLQKEREQLERVGLEQGLSQLSGRLGVPEEEVQEMHKRLSGRDISLDVPVNEEGSTRLVDLQSEPDPSSIDEELGAREQVKLLHEKI